MNTAAPTIGGIKTNGQTLTAATGSWSNSPTSYAYQWKRAGTNISGATASTYLLVTGDVGSAITVAVTATNAIGSSSAAVSIATSAIAAVLSISGTPITTATQNSAYTGFSASGAGGHTGYVYSIASGTLPTGLSLNTSTGGVSGTPTVVQTQTGIVIRVTDADGLTADLASFQIAVSVASSVYYFDAGSKTSNVALTNGNLTAENTGAGWGNVRLNLPIPVGASRDVEVTVNANASNGIIIGYCGSTVPTTSDFIGGASVTSFGLASNYLDPGAALFGGAVETYLHCSYGAVGDVVNVDFNESANKCWWRVNGGVTNGANVTGSKDWNFNSFSAPVPDQTPQSLRPTTSGGKYISISLAPGCKVTINTGFSARTYTNSSGQLPGWNSGPFAALEP